MSEMEWWIDMFEVLSNQQLKDAISNDAIIEDADLDNCEQIKYDFRLGEKILKASFKRAVIYSQLTAAEKAQCEVAPGEVVFVMTKEKLHLPNNIFCQLSNKRKIGHGGIVILGGLMVDPSYSGHLIFGLYNVSSTPYTLKPGRKLIAGVFYKTDSKDSSSGGGDVVIPDPIEDFPDELVDSMSKYQPFSPTGASEKLKLLQQRISLLENRLNDDSEWKNTFKNGLDGVSQKLDDITDSLRSEIEARQNGQLHLERKLAVLRGIGLVLGGLLGGGIVSLLVMWLGGILGLG